MNRGFAHGLRRVHVARSTGMAKPPLSELVPARQEFAASVQWTLVEVAADDGPAALPLGGKSQPSFPNRPQGAIQSTWRTGPTQPRRMPARRLSEQTSQVRLGSVARKLMSFLLLAIVFRSAPRAPACGLDWSTSHDHFDGVDKFGCVSLWKTVGKLDLGNGFVLPLQIHFSSNEETNSPYLGWGWTLPFLESHIVFREENLVEMHEPDGRTRLFWRDANDLSLFHGQGGWLAQSQGEFFTAWASCGWKLVYSNGRLASLTEPKNRRLDFTYRDGMLREVREAGEIALTVETKFHNGRDTTLVFNGRRLELDVKPASQGQASAGQTPTGQNAANDSHLAQLTITNGQEPVERYEPKVNEKGEPTLKLVRKDAPERLLVWDNSSKRILSDGEWHYDITPGKNKWSNAAIRRTNARGETEFWRYDGPLGLAIERHLDGTETESRWFVGGQGLSGKPKSRVIRTRDRTISQQFVYDKSGHLVRVEDSTGATHIMNWQNGGITSESIRSVGGEQDGFQDEKNFWKKDAALEVSAQVLDPDELAVTRSTPDRNIIQYYHFRDGLLFPVSH